MIAKNYYCVYPRLSLSTNWMDDGTHHKNGGDLLQVELETEKRIYNFPALSESRSVYDSFCELTCDLAKKKYPLVNEVNFTVDLYGCKPLEKVSTRYLLTTKKTNNYYKAFKLNLKPHEENLKKDCFNVDDQVILARKENLNDSLSSLSYEKK